MGGFVRGSSACHAVHFKGTNAVLLHGDAWRIDHGTTYLLEEGHLDFSNHAKEAALMASCMHTKSLALCANGDPTVACNVARFLQLCSPGRVFTICGMHGPSGRSGAAASFPLSAEQLNHYFGSLRQLAPTFFGNVSVDPNTIAASLSTRPLRLLHVDLEKGCTEYRYTLQVGAANNELSPGFTAEQKSIVKHYAD